MWKCLEEIDNNLDYFGYHNKNLTKQQDNRLMAIKGLVEKLKNTHLWFEVARNEVETAIDDILNNENYAEYQQELDKLTDEDINRIAWSVCDDEYSWESVYDVAKSRIYDEIGV